MDKDKAWLKEWDELDEIGRGGQGIVTKLRNKNEPNKYAVLKSIVPRWQNNKLAEERLKQEAQALSTLQQLQANIKRGQIYLIYT
jgi:hypothetical protein